MLRNSIRREHLKKEQQYNNANIIKNDYYDDVLMMIIIIIVLDKHKNKSAICILTLPPTNEHVRKETELKRIFICHISSSCMKK